jgi:hypothetical protein
MRIEIMMRRCQSIQQPLVLIYNQIPPIKQKISFENSLKKLKPS